MGFTHQTNHSGDENPELSTQHMATFPREHPVEPETEIGAACFEPSTALFLQDPLNQDTHDPARHYLAPLGQ